MTAFKTTVVFVILLLSAACVRLPRVKLPGASASAPRDNGSPAELNTSHSTTTIPLPAASVIEIQPDKPAEPVRITTPAPAIMTVESTTQHATTGTIDTTVASRRVDQEARRPLLFAAIAAVAGAVLFFWLKYPTPALLCGVAAGVFFICWQISGLPAWFWAVGLIAVAVGGGIYFGYERREKSSNSVS